MKLWGDPRVMALIDSRSGLNREQVEAKLNKEIICEKKSGVQYWKVVEKETGGLIGCCGPRPWIYEPNDASAFEIGFHIVSKEEGQNYTNPREGCHLNLLSIRHYLQSTR